MKLLKKCYIFVYNCIYVSKQFSFILVSMLPNTTKSYFSFDRLEESICQQVIFASLSPLLSLHKCYHYEE